MQQQQNNFQQSPMQGENLIELEPPARRANNYMSQLPPSRNEEKIMNIGQPSKSTQNNFKQPQSSLIGSKPYVVIIEQPAQKSIRFRYECESKTAGSIPGASSSPEIKTYPQIKVVGYTGKARVIVSCVTKDAPYRPHPHRLVGRIGNTDFDKGVYSTTINSSNMTIQFTNIGVQCVKKADIDASLAERARLRIDPYRTGYDRPQPIDLNAVRLCFQVFIQDGNGDYKFPLHPVVSDIIYDKKSVSELIITELSDCTSPVEGGKRIILLCDKVAKEDISIKFYEEQDGHQIWCAYGDFTQNQVHRMYAISFTTPAYRNLNILEPTKVFIQLERPSDKACSEPLEFQYVSRYSSPTAMKKRRLDSAQFGQDFHDTNMYIKQSPPATPAAVDIDICYPTPNNLPTHNYDTQLLKNMIPFQNSDYPLLQLPSLSTTFSQHVGSYGTTSLRSLTAINTDELTNMNSTEIKGLALTLIEAEPINSSEIRSVAASLAGTARAHQQAEAMDEEGLSDSFGNMSFGKK